MLGSSLRTGPRAPPTSNVDALTRQLEDGEVEVNATVMTREELIEWSKRLKASAHRVKTLKILCVPRGLMWATYHYSQMQQHPEVQHVYATPEHKMGVKVASANAQHHLVRMAFYKAVCAVLMKAPVEELVLGLRLSESGYTMLSDALAANTTLKRLSFAGSHMGDERFMWLKPGLKANNSLEELDLTACALTDEAAISMAAVIKAHVDRRMALVFDEQLRQYPDTSLPAHRAHLDHHAQLRAIAKSVDDRCGGLLHLELAENKLTDKAVRPLCAALAYDRRLIFLSLRANKLTAAAETELIALMKEHQALLRVDLRQNADPNLGILKLKRRVAPRVFSAAMGFQPNPAARGLRSPARTETSMPLWALRDEAGGDSLGPTPMGTPRPSRAPNSPGRMSAVSWGDMHLLVRGSPTGGPPAARGRADSGTARVAPRGPGGGAGGRASQAPWLARQPSRTGSLRRRALERTMSAPASPADSRQSSFQDFAQFAAGIPQPQGGAGGGGQQAPQHPHGAGMSRLGTQAQGARAGEAAGLGQSGGGGGGNGMPSVFGAPSDQSFFREVTLSGDDPRDRAAAALVAGDSPARSPTRLPHGDIVYDTPLRGAGPHAADGKAAERHLGGSPVAGVPPAAQANWFGLGPMGVAGVGVNNPTAAGIHAGIMGFPFGPVPLPGGLTLEDLPPALAMRVAQTVGRAAATMARVGGPLPPTLQQLHTLLQSPGGAALAAAASAAVAASSTQPGGQVPAGQGSAGAAPWVLLDGRAGATAGPAVQPGAAAAGATGPAAPPPGVWAQAVPLAVPLAQPQPGAQQAGQRMTHSAEGAPAGPAAQPHATGVARSAPVLPTGMGWAMAPAPAAVWLSPGNSGGGAGPAAGGEPAAWMAVPVAGLGGSAAQVAAAGAGTDAGVQPGSTVPRPAAAPGTFPQVAAAAAAAPAGLAPGYGVWPGALTGYGVGGGGALFGAAAGAAGAPGVDATDTARQQAFLSMLHRDNLLAGQGDYDYLFSQPRALGARGARARAAGQQAASSSPGSMMRAPSKGRSRRAGAARVKVRSAAKSKGVKRRQPQCFGSPRVATCRACSMEAYCGSCARASTPSRQRGVSPAPSHHYGSARKVAARTPAGRTLSYRPGKRLTARRTRGSAGTAIVPAGHAHTPRGRQAQRRGPAGRSPSHARSRSRSSSPRQRRRRQATRKAAGSQLLHPGATPDALAALERSLLQMAAEVDALEAAAAATAQAARQAETAAAAAAEREAHERAAAAAAEHAAATAAAERAAKAASAAEHAAVAAAQRATVAERRAQEASRRAKTATAQRATVAATTAVDAETARISALQTKLQSLTGGGVKPYPGTIRGSGVNVNTIIQQLDRWCGLRDDALLDPPDPALLQELQQQLAVLEGSSPRRRAPTQLPLRSGRDRDKETQTQQLADQQTQTPRPQESTQTQTLEPQADQQTQTQAQLYMLEQLREIHYQQQQRQLLQRLQQKLQQLPGYRTAPAAGSTHRR